MLTDAKIRSWRATGLQDIDYHMRQFDAPYRSTVHLARFMGLLLKSAAGEALDVGCGAGANIHYLSRELPGYRWTGVDIAGDALFSHGRERLASAGCEARLLTGDFYRLTELLPARQFDLVLSLQTLQVIECYEPALEQLLKMTRGWLFVTGLFCESQVDALIQVKDYTWPDELKSAYFYNIYSLPRFQSFCEARGAREVLTQDFQMDVDLPKPAAGGLGTYTELLADGRRLQFTGPIFQPWKFIAVRMGDA
jgi:ubiquinone/menaquinone biosynthesis C-methylase UbiE